MEAESSQKMPEESIITHTFILCQRCRQDSSSKSPKLLQCLHNYCYECLESMKTAYASGIDKYICHICQQETTCKSVVDNKFISDIIIRSQTSNQATKDYICQGCEENVSASSFCTDCRDWLCDQCVFAHRRVRVTKDHTIEPKENVRDDDDPKAKIEYCSVHPSETLKYFCPSCDALTCRDCQLLEHQKHDFKSVGQASDKHKSWLLQMADKLQHDVQGMEETQSLIQQKIDDILEKEKTESDKIKQFAIIFITEINRRGRAMLEDLKALCASQRTKLEHRNLQLQQVLDRYRHTIEFMEEIINNANNSTLLQMRSVVGNQVMSIHQNRPQGFDPRYRFDVAFGFNPQIVKEMMPKMCHLTCNGQPFSGENMNRRFTPLSQQSPQPARTSAELGAISTVHGEMTQTSAAAHNAMASRTATVSTTWIPPPTSSSSSSTSVPVSTPAGNNLVHHATGSGHISSSTGASTTFPSLRMPDSVTNDDSPNQGGRRTPENSNLPVSRDSSVSHLDPKNFSFDSDPRKFLNVRVKQEKRDYSFEMEKTSTYAGGNKTPRSENSNMRTLLTSAQGPSHQSPATVSTATEGPNQKTPPLGTAPHAPLSTPPTCEIGTVLSLPEYGLEAEARTVYIPASAPFPGPPTPRKHDSQDDPNEDWCAVCHDGGELLCCGQCPKVFHYRCHVPEIPADPGEDWRCGLCVDDLRVRMESEPSRFVVVNGERKRKAPMGLLPQEIKACERILLELFCHPNSVPFHEPVPKNTPLYYQIIRTPMDFKTIHSKLQPKHFNHYKSLQEFIDDASLVFSNCKMYNKIGSEVRQWGVIVESFFMEILQRLLPFIHFEMRGPSPEEVREPSPKRLCMTSPETRAGT